MQLAKENDTALHLVVGVHAPTAVSVPSGGASVSDPGGGATLRRAA